MTALITRSARAYVNFGRWIADCPADCGGAMKLEPGQRTFHCAECKHLCSLVWPLNAQEIWDELQRRPAQANRNWFPRGHELAVRAGCPHGQTVDELAEERHAHGGG